MKTTRLVRLQTWTIIVLAVYASLAVYMFYAIPTGQPMWSSIGHADSEIKSADLQRLQSDLHSAVSSLATFRHDKNELLLICFVATVGIVGFLSWSLFVIGRVKKECLINHAA
jgi:hypothetical protein